MRAAASRAIAAALALALVAASPGRADDDADSAVAEAEAKALFEWFEGLGFPGVAGKAYVRVTTGAWSRVGDGPRVYHTRDGFLLDETDERFTVVHDLEPVPYARTGDADTPPPVFEELDLGAEVKAAIDREVAARAAGGEDEDPAAHFERRLSGTRTSSRLELFFLARGAHANGLAEPARRLLALARSAPGEDDPKDARVDLAAQVRRDLAHTLMWETVLACGEPGTARAQLRDRFRFIAEKMPESRHAASAREHADILDRMVKEDEARAAAAAAPGAKPFAALSPAEQARELIFELRDQNGQQWSQPGWVDIWEDPRGEASPAHRLRALGHAAVPALIEAAEDPRLTRSVGYHRSFYFSHQVLTIGEVARTVLGGIAHRRFDRKAEAEAWWRTVREKGEVEATSEALREHIAAGNGFEAAGQASRLIALDAARGVKETMAAARGARGDLRGYLVSTLQEVPGDEVHAFLVEEVRAGPDRRARLSAAGALADRGSDVWVAPLGAELRKIAASPPDARGEEPLAANLAILLGTRAGVRGLEEVRRSLPSLDVDARLATIVGIAAVPADGSPEDALVERILVAALGDDDIRFGMSGSRGETSYQDPRLGDMAAFYLAARWRWPDPFEFYAPPHARARLCAELRNEWLRRRGLEPKPLPEAPPRLPEGADPATVVGVTVEDGAAPIDAGARARFAALAGRPLAVVDLAGALLGAATATPTGRLEIHVYRAAAGAGVSLALRSSPPRGMRGETGSHYGHSARVGKRGIAGMGGGGGFANPEETVRDLVKPLEEILAAPAAEDGEMRLYLEWRP